MAFYSKISKYVKSHFDQVGEYILTSFIQVISVQQPGYDKIYIQHAFSIVDICQDTAKSRNCLNRQHPKHMQGQRNAHLEIFPIFPRGKRTSQNREVTKLTPYQGAKVQMVSGLTGVRYTYTVSFFLEICHYMTHFCFQGHHFENDTIQVS